MAEPRALGAPAAEVAPSRVPAGRRFAPGAESLLDDDLRALAGKLPSAGGGLFVLAEFAGPRGIADLLAVTRALPTLERRLSRGSPFLDSPADASIVAAIPLGRLRTGETIARLTGMSPEQSAVRLRRLAADGLLTEVGSGYRRPSTITTIGRCYAIEAKVSDWQQGLRQALRYASWADAAAVTLLQPPRDLPGVGDRYRALGIGLAVRDTWVVRPRLNKPVPALRLLTSEMFAASVAAYNPSGFA
ncbi:MAG: hypothetical protein WCF04_11370 [Candidatus Nanopelagicales bacterium]